MIEKSNLTKSVTEFGIWAELITGVSATFIAKGWNERAGSKDKDRENKEQQSFLWKQLFAKLHFFPTPFITSSYLVQLVMYALCVHVSVSA